MFSTINFSILIIGLLNLHCYLCNTILFDANIDSDSINKSDLPASKNKTKIQLNVVVNEENLEFHVRIDLKNWVWEQNTDENYKKQHPFIKKLYFALGTDDLLGDPIDIIGINLERDERLFGHKLCKNESLCEIQDFNWCKQSNELKLDSRQHYTLDSLRTEDSGNTILVNFTRNWHTCDNKDIQISVKSINIWWALKEVSISSELLLIESEIERQSGVKLHSLNSTNDSEDSTTKKSRERIDLGRVRLEQYFKNKKLQSQAFQGTNPTYEILNALAEFGFEGPVKASWDQLLFGYAKYLMILKCDMAKEIMDIYAYRCTIDEYLSMRSTNMKNNFYITALIEKGKPNNYFPNVKGIIIEVCPLKQLQQNYLKTSSTDNPEEEMEGANSTGLNPSENEAMTGGVGGSGSNFMINHLGVWIMGFLSIYFSW